MTSASSTRTFLCLRTICRIAGAIWPGGRRPVATWYRSGWNRWWLRRSITVTSTALAGQESGGGEAPETTANDHDAVTAGFSCASSVVAHPSRSVKCSPTLMAFAIAVKAGFTAPMLGKKLVSTT